MSRRKPEEVPYVELTAAMTRSIENLDRSALPYYGASDNFGEYDRVEVSEMSYRGSKYIAHQYVSDTGESRGIALVKGAKTIVTTVDKIKRSEARYQAEKEEYNRLKELLKYESKPTF